jgi:thymidylate kinase
MNPESAPSLGWETSLTGRFVRSLLEAYERSHIRYVVLRNYERWPEDFGKDVDLVVHRDDLAVSHTIVADVARAHGLEWSVRQKRSGHHTYYLLPTPVDGIEKGVLLDIRPDLVHQGFCYLPGEVVLAGRRKHEGFFVPTPAMESLGILLHAVIDSKAVRPSYAQRLRELGTGDVEEFRKAATALVGATLAAELAALLDARTPEAAVALRGRLMRARATCSPGAAVRWIKARSGAVWDRVRDFILPPGDVVILVGPDGAGKSTLTENVVKRLAATRIPASPVYLGAQKPLLPTRRLSQHIHKAMGHSGKAAGPKDVNRKQRLRGILHIMADKWARYLVYVRPRLVRGEVVVVDRYFYDLRTFAHPLVKSRFVENFVMRMVPEPALAFCLVADPEIITIRKHELTVAETARQIECYRGISRWVRNFREIPADGHLPSVIDSITSDVVRVYAARRSPGVRRA